jgi:hypothetical protein
VCPKRLRIHFQWHSDIISKLTANPLHLLSWIPIPRRRFRRCKHRPLTRHIIYISRTRALLSSNFLSESATETGGASAYMTEVSRILSDSVPPILFLIRMRGIPCSYLTEFSTAMSRLNCPHLSNSRSIALRQSLFRVHRSRLSTIEAAQRVTTNSSFKLRMATATQLWWAGTSTVHISTMGGFTAMLPPLPFLILSSSPAFEWVLSTGLQFVVIVNVFKSSLFKEERKQ